MKNSIGIFSSGALAAVALFIASFGSVSAQIPVYQTTVYQTTRPVVIQNAPMVPMAPVMPAAPAVVYPQPVYVAPPPSFYVAPPRVYVAPPVIDLGFGFGRGWGVGGYVGSGVSLGFSFGHFNHYHPRHCRW
jgi:hypothetical protein